MAEQCNECGKPVSVNAEACPHCASPVPTDEAVRKLYYRLLDDDRTAAQASEEYSSLSEAEAEAKLTSWLQLLSRDQYTSTVTDFYVVDEMRRLTHFLGFLSFVRKKFPQNALAAEVEEWGGELIKAKMLISEDISPYLTEAWLREHGLDFWINWGGLSDDVRDYLGLSVVPTVAPSDIWPKDLQHESSDDLHRIYCRDKDCGNVERFFTDYRMLVDHDLQTSCIDESVAQHVADQVKYLTYNDPGSEPGKESLAALKSLMRRESWDYVGRDANDTLFILKDYHLILYKRGRTQSPSVIHLGDVDEVRIEDEHVASVQKLELPYFERDSSPKSPGYAKSALIGGVLAGPVGAMVGAGYAADRASRGSSKLTTKTFESRSHHIDSEVFFTNRFLPGAELYLKLEGAPVAFELINGEKLDGFLDVLEYRIPRARELRTVEFAWVDQHGSAEGLTNRASGFLDAVAEVDARIAEELEKSWDRAAAAELNVAEETRAEETRAEERRVAAEQRAADAEEKRRRQPGVFGWLTLASGVLAWLAIIVGLPEESMFWGGVLLLSAHAAVILGVIALATRDRRWPTWTGLAIGMLPVGVFWWVGATYF